MRSCVDHAKPYVGLALHDANMDHLGGMKSDVRDSRHGAGEEIERLVLLRCHTAVCSLVGTIFTQGRRPGSLPFAFITQCCVSIIDFVKLGYIAASFIGVVSFRQL